MSGKFWNSSTKSLAKTSSTLASSSHLDNDEKANLQKKDQQKLKKPRPPHQNPEWVAKKKGLNRRKSVIELEMEENKKNAQNILKLGGLKNLRGRVNPSMSMIERKMKLHTLSKMVCERIFNCFAVKATGARSKQEMVLNRSQIKSIVEMMEPNALMFKDDKLFEDFYRSMDTDNTGDID